MFQDSKSQDTLLDEKLDAKFGELIEAIPCAPEELSSTPESLVKLDRKSASNLRTLTSPELSKLGLLSCIYAQTPILWAVDRYGSIWLAIEEIVTEQSRRFVRPRVRGLNPKEGETRLGHPALVGFEGRIAGELLFDQGWGTLRPGWKITNSSGRFGMKAGRSSHHLENVAAEFAAFDINVEAVFLGVRE